MTSCVAQSVYREWEALERTCRSQQHLWSVSISRLETYCTRIETFIRAFSGFPRRTELDREYVRRCRATLFELMKILDKRRNYAKFIKCQVGNKGKILDNYEVLRSLGETTLGGEVVLARCKRTQELVAIKRSPLYRMALGSKEFPLHEAKIYRIFQDQNDLIPLPQWFQRLTPYMREAVGVKLVTTLTLAPREQESALQRLKQDLCTRFRIGASDAQHLIKHFSLLIRCQPFFALFGQYRKSRAGPINRPGASQGDKNSSGDEKSKLRRGNGSDGGGSSSSSGNDNTRGGHRHIAKFIEDYADQENYYMVLELCNGGDFFAHIQKNSGLSNQRVCCTYFVQLLHAVSYMHRRGLYHLDLSLEQMMLSEQPAAGASSSSSANRTNEQKLKLLKLIDFGMTRSPPVDARTGSPTLFAPCAYGKPGYKPPEMWQRRPFDGEKVDIFCLGVILALMALGWPPFKMSLSPEYILVARGDLAQLMRRYGLNTKAEEYTRSGLIDLITRMLASNFGDRPTLAEVIRHQWIRDNSPPEILRELLEIYRERDPQEKKDEKDLDKESETTKQMDIDSKMDTEAKEEFKDILEWDATEFRWQISPPRWLMLFTREDRSSILREVKSAWQLTNREERRRVLYELHDRITSRFNCSNEQATSLMWYVFLELSNQELKREEAASAK